MSDDFEEYCVNLLCEWDGIQEEYASLRNSVNLVNLLDILIEKYPDESKYVSIREEIINHTKGVFDLVLEDWLL